MSDWLLINFKSICKWFFGAIRKQPITLYLMKLKIIMTISREKFGFEVAAVTSSFLIYCFCAPSDFNHNNA